MNADKVRQLLDLCEKYEYKPDQIHITNLTDFLSENASQVLGICKTALAALAAEPVVEVTTWWPLGVDGGEQPFLQPLGDLPPKGSKLYTTPPAKLLRPVELPGGFSPAIGDIFDRQAPVMRRDREQGCWIHKAVVAELLRSLGHEVKND